MAKLLVVCHRNRATSLDARLFEAVSGKIMPDNIVPNAPRVWADGGLGVAVLNPTESVRTVRASACVGHLIDPTDDWCVPRGTIPDGSFALARADDTTVELVSDACASRTIWYVLTDTMFVASTSQRAIVFLLGDFQPSGEAPLWMLSAGSLGPGVSWDRRIRCLTPNSSVRLDRAAWVLRETAKPVQFKALPGPERVHRKNLLNALVDTFDRLEMDNRHWTLLLSGGMDSRCILTLLKRKDGLRCVTWGPAEAASLKRGDAVVARKVAEHYGLPHRYLNTNGSGDTSIRLVFDRLLAAGEGRTDDFVAYMDGCDIWRRFFTEGTSGIIRGDVIFSPHPVRTHDHVRWVNGAVRCSDYANLADLERWSGARQQWPDELEKRADETLDTWRDRLTYAYRAPAVWAALNEIKSAYVEIMSPLLSSRITEAIARLPDDLRTNRVLYERVVRSLSPPIEFATVTLGDHKKVIRSAAFVDEIRTTLDTDEARAWLPEEVIALVTGGMRVSEYQSCAGRPLPSLIRQLVPARIRLRRKGMVSGRNIDANVLGKRAYIAVRMCALLEKDARDGSSAKVDLAMRTAAAT